MDWIIIGLIGVLIFFSIASYFIVMFFWPELLGISGASQKILLKEHAEKLAEEKKIIETQITEKKIIEKHVIDSLEKK